MSCEVGLVVVGLEATGALSCVRFACTPCPIARLLGSFVRTSHLTPCTISNTQHVYSVNPPSLPIHNVPRCFIHFRVLSERLPIPPKRSWIPERSVQYETKNRLSHKERRNKTIRCIETRQIYQMPRSGVLVSISCVAWISNVAVDHIKSVKFPVTGWISLIIARTAGR